MRRAMCLSLTLTAVAFGACGGDDNGGDSQPSGSKEEFIRSGDEICERVNATIEDINEEAQQVGGSQDEQFAALEPIFRRAIEVQDDAIEEFRALQPPPDDAEVIDKYLDAAEDQRATLDELAGAAAARDPTAFASATERLNRLSERRRSLAQGYGFRECGSDDG